MTPQEFADSHGLTLEEAQLILARRSQDQPCPPNSPIAALSQAHEDVGEAVDRLAFARKRLAETQKRVGVHPVSAEGDELVKGYDPDADVGKVVFFERKGNDWYFITERKKTDPDGWEDPP